MRTNWTDEKFDVEIRKICVGMNRFPTNSELQNMGRGDLSNQVIRRGGYVKIAAELGFERVHSDSDTGWDGEKMAVEILSDVGIRSQKTELVRAPFDILVEGCVRIDVKAAKYAEYGICKGWFYRIGKLTPADVLMLVQLDTRTAYYLPWHVCPQTNVTISRTGGIYANCRNAYWIVNNLADRRKSEIEMTTNLTQLAPQL